MTPEQATELLPTIQAFASGKTIQFRPRFCDCVPYWADTPNPSFDAYQFIYRVKPDEEEGLVRIAPGVRVTKALADELFKHNIKLKPS